MTQRIAILTDLTLKGEMYAHPVKTQFDEQDANLSRQKRESKRLCEYILNQEPVLTPYQTMTGFFNCDSSIVGDAFRRAGHETFEKLKRELYLKKYLENITTFEWQHATADYQKLLDEGLLGIIAEIEQSLKEHTQAEEVEFLQALKDVANTLIAWAHKCAKHALELAETVENPEYKCNLQKLANALKRVPATKPSSFYEAILSIYICFSADPDSVGTLDRYLTPFYERDIQKGTLTREQAKEYLQELFLMLQAATKSTSSNFTRGGESHFCIGGYLPDGRDGFNELSKLILESLIELPTWIPQVSLRWTAKTPRETLRFAMDCERKDPHKRVAFQNDEKRIKCYTEICGFPFEKAVGYTTAGCNEPTFLGAIAGGSSMFNFAQVLEVIFHQKADLIINAPDYESFYQVFIQQLFLVLNKAYEYDNWFNLERAKDINYLSSIFFQGCIDKAKSLTQGVCDTAVASPSCMGITNVIDSLIAIKQFVFDEKVATMYEMIAALRDNWVGYEPLRTLILKRGDFFGNDTARSNEVAQRLYADLYHYLKGKANVHGYPWLIGDLVGYRDHHKKFGENMNATPDGRRAGEPLKFGLGQSEGKDRNGLTALLNSIAKIDPNGIGCGATVTNVTIDETLIKKDEYFEKTVDIFENYFKNGGVHFQLNYVSKEDLLAAKQTPDEYKHLRVRVSGFSDYFVKLSSALQDDVIARTEHKSK